MALKTILPTRRRVLVEKAYRESTNMAGLSEGTPISSFAGYLPSQRSVASAGSVKFPASAAVANPICMKGPDCGWEQAYIGTCQHGAGVELKAQAQCSSIRVCSGVTGCERDNKEVPHAALTYSSYIQPTVVQQGTECTLKFNCPSASSEGLTGSTHGTYGIMVKSSNGGTLKLVANSGKYPAPEIDVFQFREGAFFGNLFEPNELSRTREVVIRNGEPVLAETDVISVALPAPSNCPIGGATHWPYQHVYACYSFVDQKFDSRDIALNAKDGVAVFDGRICVKGTGGCYPHTVDSCSSPSLPGSPKCDWNSQKQVYEHCKDKNKMYASITTYLDDPCSLVTPQQCAALRAHRPPLPIEVPQ
jgi:hypothetical protein